MSLLELGHGIDKGCSSSERRVEVSLSVTVLVGGKRRLRYEGPQSQIVSDVVDDHELLVENSKLLARLGESTMDIAERPFDQ